MVKLLYAERIIIKYLMEIVRLFDSFHQYLSISFKQKNHNMDACPVEDLITFARDERPPAGSGGILDIALKIEAKPTRSPTVVAGLMRWME